MSWILEIVLVLGVLALLHNSPNSFNDIVVVLGVEIICRLVDVWVAIKRQSK